MRTLLFLCITATLLPLHAQQSNTPSFQVATIKPGQPDEGTAMQIRGSRFATTGTTVLDLLKYAYNVHADQIVGGPTWLRSQKFDVLADPETETRPTSDQMKSMVAKLLTDRFHLVMHTEQKQLSVYALVKLNTPPKLTTTKRAEEPNGIPTVGYSPPGKLEAGYATMANFATFLQRYAVDRPVIDQTGIAGRFDITLKWTPDNYSLNGKVISSENDPNAPPGLFTAIQEQLGIKLKPTRALTNVFVIDSMQQPSEN